MPPCGSDREAYRRSTVLWRSGWGQPPDRVMSARDVDGPLKRFRTGPIGRCADQTVASTREVQLEPLPVRAVRERIVETRRQAEWIQIDQPPVRRFLPSGDHAAGRSNAGREPGLPRSTDIDQCSRDVDLSQCQGHLRGSRDRIRDRAAPRTGHVSGCCWRCRVLRLAPGARQHQGDENDRPGQGSARARLNAKSPSRVAHTNKRSFQTRGIHMKPAFQSPIRHRCSPVSASSARSSPLKKGR